MVISGNSCSDNGVTINGSHPIQSKPRCHQLLHLDRLWRYEVPAGLWLHLAALALQSLTISFNFSLCSVDTKLPRLDQQSLADDAARLASLELSNMMTITFVDDPETCRHKEWATAIVIATSEETQAPEGPWEWEMSILAYHWPWTLLEQAMTIVESSPMSKRSVKYLWHCPPWSNKQRMRTTVT